MKGTLLYASPPSLLVPWSAQGNPKCYYSTVGDSLCTIPVYLLSQNFRQHGMTFMNESADLSPLDSSHLSSHHSIKLGDPAHLEPITWFLSNPPRSPTASAAVAMH